MDFLVGYCLPLLLDQSLVHFYLLACILASLINNSVAFRLVTWRRQAASYHVELKAVVFLHQTQHKHTKTCKTKMYEIPNREIIWGVVPVRGRGWINSESRSSLTKFRLTYFRQTPILMCREELKTQSRAILFILYIQLRWGDGLSEQIEKWF